MKTSRDRTVLAIAVLLAIVGGALTSRLKVRSDLSYLLPESTPSVRQLRAIEKRARVSATFMIGAESDDPAARARAGEELLRRIRALDAQALGIGDYGVTEGAAANLFTIAGCCVPEAVAAHPPRKLVLFDGKVVARDGMFLPAPAPIASTAST